MYNLSPGTKRNRKERGRKEGGHLSSKKEEEAETTAAELAIRELYIDNKNILDKMGNIEKREHDLLVKKYKCILALAANFEKLHQLGDHKEPLEAICSTIVSLVRDERGFFTSERLIRDILPYQYKN
jgi:hypothetical protein